MHTQPNPDLRQLADRLLDELATEEQLLRAAREGVMGLYASLRKGDIAAVQSALPESDRIADQLKNQGEIREATARYLAHQLGLSNANVSLADLATRLQEPYSSRLRTVRTTMRDLTAQVEQFRFTNANLIDRLRSYFQDVLSTITVQDTVVRYGPSGEKVSAPTARMTFVSG